MTAHITDPNIPPSGARDIERNIDAAVIFEEFTVLTLPDAAGPKRWIFVTDETGGPTPAFNDGTDWRRLDLAVVS